MLAEIDQLSRLIEAGHALRERAAQIDEASSEIKMQIAAIDLEIHSLTDNQKSKWTE